MRSEQHAGWDGLIGAARRDITPPLGINARMWGAAAHDVAERVHRPLTATALALRDRPDAPPLTLVAIDLGWWRAVADERAIRDAALAALGVGEERLIIACSHTHAGPAIASEDADRPGGSLIAPYLARLRDLVAELCRAAVAAARPGRLEWATGRCDLACRRDQRDPERGRVLIGYEPDHGGGEPADDTLLVGRATAADGAPLATVVNYACHPTTLAHENRALSPDFIGAMRETVERETAGAPCLFLQGASGELAPREQYVADPAVADRHGRRLGHATLATLAGMLPPGTRLAYAGALESGAPLGLWRSEPRASAPGSAALRREVELPLQAWPTLAGIDRDLAASTDRVLAERLRRRRRVRAVVGDGDTALAPVWAWRLGEALLVAHKDEAYSRLQRRLRAAFPGRALAVLNLANGAWAGYLVPEELHGDGRYQTWAGPYAAGALERLERGCLSALSALTAAGAAA